MLKTINKNISPVTVADLIKILRGLDKTAAVFIYTEDDRKQIEIDSTINGVVDFQVRN